MSTATPPGIPIVRVLPKLPQLQATGQYTPLQLIEMIAYFYVHQGTMPESTTEENDWDPVTLQSTQDLVFPLPRRPVFTSRFGRYKNVVDLVTRYLSGQDITQHPLLLGVTEQDIWPHPSPYVDVDTMVDLFIQYYTCFSEYPACGPTTWNRNTLWRCQTHGLQLPPFKRSMKRVGGMKLIKRLADEKRVEIGMAIEKASPVTPTVEKPTWVKPEGWTIAQAEPPKDIIDIEFSTVEVMPQAVETPPDEVTELLEENKQLQEDVDQASTAIDKLRAEVKQLRDTNHKLTAENTSLQAEIGSYAMVIEKRNKLHEQYSLPLAVRLLFDPFTVRVLDRYSADSDMVFIRQMFESAAKAIDLEVTDV